MYFLAPLWQKRGRDEVSAQIGSHLGGEVGRERRKKEEYGRKRPLPPPPSKKLLELEMKVEKSPLPPFHLFARQKEKSSQSRIVQEWNPSFLVNY